MKAIFKSAVHLILINNNKILVQKRKGTKLWPGYYGLPAGHIEVGENQYEALIREIKEELGIEIKLDDIINEYVVLRRNFFKIDGKVLEPYIDYYFELNKYSGNLKIMEKNKCDELIWVDINNLPNPFINYEGEFLASKSMKTYNCLTVGAYKDSKLN